MPESPTILLRGPDESWPSFTRRMKESEGELIAVLRSEDNRILLNDEERAQFLEECAAIRYRLRLATKEPVVLRDAKHLGISVFDRTRKLRRAVQGMERGPEALRAFSPSLWRQQWRSKLQTIGLLSVPRVRIWVLVGVSVVLFGFVVLRLLPSAEIRVWPRTDILSQTMNITLAKTGAILPQSGAVRTLPIVVIQANLRKSITFDSISPEFTGTDASVQMTVINDSNETYSLRKGTRLLNQAGMVFRLQEPGNVPAKGKLVFNAKADHEDLYGKVIGARGNVPAGLQWEFPGLAPEERKVLYAKNLVEAKGGTTSQRTVLQQRDIDLAQKRLQQELLASARQYVEEERQLMNAQQSDRQIELLLKDDVISLTYSGFVLPTQFLGQPVTSVPIEGSIQYTVYGYDLQLIQSTYSKELLAHAGDGKRLLPESIHIDPQRVIIIEYDDALHWIKLTVDIVGTEQFELDPLTPVGARFGKKVREAIAGLSVGDAQRILRNFPEVERVEIRLWPPWSASIPTIPSNITIAPQ